MSRSDDNQCRRALVALSEAEAAAELLRKDCDRAFTSAGVVLTEIGEARRIMGRAGRGSVHAEASR